MGITIILCIVCGLGLGYGLDMFFKTSPTFLIVGIIVGTMMSFMFLYQMSRKTDAR